MSAPTMTDVAATPAPGSDTAATHAGASDETLPRIGLDALRPAPWQSRGTRADVAPRDDAADEVLGAPDVEHHALLTLARAIHDAGDLLEPVVVRPAPGEPGVYQLIAGHRRAAAVRLLAEGRVRDAAELDAHALGAHAAPCGRRATDEAGRAPDGAAPAVLAPAVLGLPAALRGPDGAPVVPARVRAVDDVQARRDTFAENAQRLDLAAWDRARAVADFHDALASEPGRAAPPEQREVAHALRLKPSTVSESLGIVAGLPPEVVDDAVRPWGWTHAHDDARYALRRLPHAALCRAARAGGPGERAATLRALLDRVRRGGAPARDGGTRGADAAPPSAEHTARSRYERLRGGEPFDFRRTRGLAASAPTEAAASLAELAPAVGLLAARAAAGAPVALETGDGGMVLVLPGDPGDLDAPLLAEALAAVLDLRDRLESARARRLGRADGDAAPPSDPPDEPGAPAAPSGPQAAGPEATLAPRARRAAAADGDDAPPVGARAATPVPDVAPPGQLGLAL